MPASGCIGALWMLAVVLACGDHSRIVEPSGEAAEGGLHVGRSPPDPTRSDASWVFDEDAVHDYQLTLEPEAWDELKASALDEQYVPAQLSVDGSPFGEVGLRFKGNNGSLRRCADRQGNLRCPKLSMKLKFDEYQQDQRFFGLKRLNFNSMWSDRTELHERLAYKLFREMGIAAPRSAHARLEVNGESLGVFSLVEQIDGRFTKHRFPGGDGNLYKEQWPITSDASALDAALETNEDTPDHRLMLQFHADLSAAAPEALPDVLGRYMHIDELMAYLAVDRVTTNWDGISGFYCRGRGCYNHNYYLYQHEHDDRFTLIPWDVDNTFSVVTPFDHVPTPLMQPEDCKARYPIFGPVGGMAAGCDAIFRALASIERERYRSQLLRLLEGPFELARLDAWLDARLEQLSPEVAADPNGPTLQAFHAAVEGLRADLQHLRSRAIAEQDGAPLPRFGLAPDSLNDFESTSALGLQLGLTRLAAPESRVAAELGEDGALEGTRELRVSFEFPAQGEPEARWARLRLPFDADSVDLSGKTSLRLRVQAETPHSLRIDIDSNLYTQPDARAVFGWDIALDGTPQIIELPLASASMPPSSPGVPETLADVLREATALLIEVRAPQRRAQIPVRAHTTERREIRIDGIELLP